MYRHLLPIAVALAITPALADPYSESWPSVILLYVHGILKEPPAGKDSVDYQERGTGFLVSHDGFVLTAGHNIPNANAFDENGYYIEGYFPVKDVDALNAEDPPVQLKLINKSQSPYDVALLKIIDLNTVKPFLRLCNDYQKEGRPDFQILGYPGGDRQLTLLKAPVSSGAGAVSNMILQVELNPGNSGSPVFNELGMVFGIAIGEKTAAGERLRQTTLAIPMSKAISTLGKDAEPLIGVSYDPDCRKQLNPKITTELNQSIQFHRDNTKGVYDNLPANGARLPKTGYGTAQLKVPTGYRLIQADSVKFDRKDIEGDVILSDDGRLLTIRGSDIGKGSYYANSTIPVKLEQTVILNNAPYGKVQTFPFSKTMNVHGQKVTRRDFNEKIPAPEGFFFKQVVKIDYQSLSHSPSKGVKVSVSRDGSALELKYTLESGPATAPWSGWVDAFITAYMVPKR